MRIVLIANVLIHGGARRAGYVVDDYDDICQGLIDRGLAKLIEPERDAKAAEGEPADVTPVDITPPDVTPVDAAAPVETKAQRKAREKAERDAKAAESDHSDPREG